VQFENYVKLLYMDPECLDMGSLCWDLDYNDLERIASVA
jgi:hypothetical protein